MKKYTLLCLLISLSAFCCAQNYRLITASSTNNFIDSQARLYSIRIDSTAIVGSDTLLFPYKILSPAYSTNCQLMLGDSSWLGHKIIANNNGNYVFFNANHDSIFIQPGAALNNNWKMFAFTNGNYIQATVSGINLQSAMGIPDSVKTISLQAKNSSNVVVPNIINGTTLSFSQNHGWIKTLNFKKFPYDTVACSLTAALNLTAAGIFNYAIGDEFHFEDHYQDPFSPSHFSYKNTVKKILSKTISLNQDTLTYTYEKCQTEIRNISTPFHIDTIVSADTSTEKIILSKNRFMSQLPYEPLSSLNGYSIASINQTHHVRQKDLYIYYQYIPPICWKEMLTGYLPSHYTYLDGLGGGYYTVDYYPANYFKLVYYKKGAVTWGTPFICEPLPTSLQLLKNDNNPISIYPNPFSEYTTITFSNYNQADHFMFRLFDCIGKVYASFPVFQQQIILPKNNLAPGIYFYELTNIQQQTNCKGKLIVN